jgi:cysteinyl-tRNA synthetase
VSGEAREAPAGEWDRLVAVLEDDFNTPEALALLHEWRGAGYLELVQPALDLFGLGSLSQLPDAPDVVKALADRRQEARERGDFDDADRLRREIEAAAWEVRDMPGGYQLVPTSR